MPLSSQAQWRQVFALAKRGELPMATAREMAAESAPYDTLPAYAGAGPDQCSPHWHHVSLPGGQTIRTDDDCHVGADAMHKENMSMQVGWGGRIPVELDMRTRGEMIHGVATIHFPNVPTPIRSTISANWREIYEALRKGTGGAQAGHAEFGRGYTSAEAALSARELLGELRMAGEGSDMVVDGLANTRSTLRGILEDAGAAAGQYPSALSMGNLSSLPMFDPGGEIGAEFNLTANDWNVEIGEDEIGSGYGKTAAISTLAALTALAGTRGRGAYGPGGAQAQGGKENAAWAALAAMGALTAAQLVGAKGRRHKVPTLSRAGGDYAVVSGAPFELMDTAQKMARTEVIRNLHRVVQKGISNPLIRNAMQLDRRGRAAFAVKAGGRIYGRAMKGDAAARRVIQKLAAQHRKGSRFAGRALRLLNLGRQRYYGARISGDHAKDNQHLVGLVDAYGGADHHHATVGHHDHELEALLEASSGVGAWEGINWVADRLKWRSMARHAGDVTGRGLLLAGRRAQAAAYTPGQL